MFVAAGSSERAAVACDKVCSWNIRFSWYKRRLTKHTGVIMAKTAKKIVRREYTKADVKELRAHSKARTPIAKVAKLTKRTVGSLRQKALRLGIGLGHRR